MRKPFIAGNWKLYKTLTEASALIDELKTELAVFDQSGLDVVVCPPSVTLCSLFSAVNVWL